VQGARDGAGAGGGAGADSAGNSQERGGGLRGAPGAGQVSPEGREVARGGRDGGLAGGGRRGSASRKTQIREIGSSKGL